MNINKFKETAVCHDIENGKLSHSLLLLSRDTYSLERFVQFTVQALMCTGTPKPCGTCAECRKFEHGNNVDVLYYPKNNKSMNSAEINELIEATYSAPYESDKKVFVIRNANGIDAGMQNKLLKTLEEPPHNTYFVLCATEDNNILQTIKSRCRLVRIPEADTPEIASVLREHGINDETARLAIEYCDHNCALALKYAENPAFIETVKLVESIFLNFRKSWQMLDYSSRLYGYNENFEDVLEIFLNVINRAVNILCGGGDKADKLAMQVAREFSPDCLVALNTEVLGIVEKRRRNCNFNALVDSFLFMILEVRHRWQI